MWNVAKKALFSVLAVFRNQILLWYLPKSVFTGFHMITVSVMKELNISRGPRPAFDYDGI